MHPSRWPSRSHADAGGAGSRGSRVRIAAWVLGVSLGLMVRADAPLAEGPKSADAEQSSPSCWVTVIVVTVPSGRSQTTVRMPVWSSNE